MLANISLKSFYRINLRSYQHFRYLYCSFLKPPSRVQQLQLLGRDMKGAQHETLWNQLEAEINLHRHKTVVKTCKMRNQSNNKPIQSPTMVKVPKHQKRRGIGQIRTVQIFKDSSEGLGISITVLHFLINILIMLTALILVHGLADVLMSFLNRRNFNVVSNKPK